MLLCEIAYVWTSCFTSGWSSGMFGTVTREGQHSSDFHKNSGPCNQRLLWINCSAVRPLKASSAGLDLESTYLHWSGDEPSWIIDRRFATKVCNLLDWFWINWMTEVESLPKMLYSMGRSSSLRIILSNFTDTTAADSSKRGIVIAFRGARRDFPMTYQQWMLPSVSTMRK